MVPEFIARMTPSHSPEDRWKNRRRLVYAVFVLSVFMILVAAFDGSDRQVSSELVIGAVALISIILTAYTGFATLDHRWQQPPEEDHDESVH